MIFLPPPPDPPNETTSASTACDTAINQAPLPPDFVPNPHIGAAYGCERPSPECGNILFAFIFGVGTGSGVVLRRDFLGCLPPEFICPAGFTLNGLICIRDRCPITSLTEIEKIPPNDSETLKLTLDLENGIDRYDLLKPAMKAAEECLRGKIINLSIPYRISATVRTTAYQTHLVEIWKKMERLARLTNPSEIQACATLRAKVATQKGCNNAGPCKRCTGGHCLVSEPLEDQNDTHTQRIAIDISRTTITPLLENLAGRKPSSMSMADFISGPPKNCNLQYLGPGDPVHFQLR